MQPTPHLSLFAPHLGRASTKVVASCAIIEKGHVLLVQEGNGHEAKRWNLPGGKSEPHESLIATAMRETREEAGHTVAVDDLLGAYRYQHRTGDVRLRVVFWAHIIGGEPPSAGNGSRGTGKRGVSGSGASGGGGGREIRDVRWFALDQVLAMPEHKLAKPQLLRAIFADLRRGDRHPLRALQHARPSPA